MTTIKNPKTCETIDTPYSNDKVVFILRDVVNGTSPLTAQFTDNRRNFATSLYNQWSRRHGSLTGSQMWWAHKIVLEAEQRAATPNPQRETVSLGAEFNQVLALFNTAKQSLKRPKISFELPTIGEVRLTVSGLQSRYPGTINVTDGGPFGNNVWYGRISKEGDFIINPRVDVNSVNIVKKFLQLLGRNPALLASSYGRKTGCCCFCRITLTDERSVYMGYGPICADHYNLPWGQRPSRNSEAGVLSQDAADIDALLAEIAN